VGIDHGFSFPLNIVKNTACLIIGAFLVDFWKHWPAPKHLLDRPFGRRQAKKLNERTFDKCDIERPFPSRWACPWLKYGRYLVCRYDTGLLVPPETTNAARQRLAEFIVPWQGFSAKRESVRAAVAI